MNRTEQVAFYVSKAEKQRLQEEADEADITLSKHLARIIETHRRDVDGDEAADRMDAEEKIERVANNALQQMETVLDQMQQRNDDLADMVTRSGAYSVANFELLKYQHGPPEATKTDALRVGSRRLRAPMTEHPDLLHPDPSADADDARDESDPLTVGTAEQATDESDQEEEEDEDEELSAADKFFKGRGRSKSESENHRW